MSPKRELRTLNVRRSPSWMTGSVPSCWAVASAAVISSAAPRAQRVMRRIVVVFIGPIWAPGDRTTVGTRRKVCRCGAYRGLRNPRLVSRCRDCRGPEGRTHGSRYSLEIDEADVSRLDLRRRDARPHDCTTISVPNAEDVARTPRRCQDLHVPHISDAVGEVGLVRSRHHDVDAAVTPIEGYAAEPQLPDLTLRAELLGEHFDIHLTGMIAFRESFEILDPLRNFQVLRTH